MQQTYTAVVKREADVWIGWIEEVSGVNCQENSRDRLLESLRITLVEAIEFNRADALGAAPAPPAWERQSRDRFRVDRLRWSGPARRGRVF